jgi:prepilin-type N-terminal cleavage/methylation domain-containing protein/prepilin-type processing-associated H-X9-DG protein
MRKQGFTLIELLVVISIIAVLAAILFPVFGAAREKARQTACASNARQLAFGILMYTQDYDDILPPSAYRLANQPRSDANTVLWMVLVAPYIMNSRVNLCPSDSLSHICSYGLNELAFVDNPKSTRLPLCMSAFQNPSSTIMLGETGTGTPGNLNDLTTPRPDTCKLRQPGTDFDDDAEARPAARHNGFASLAFMDGHEKAMRLDQFYTNQSPVDLWFTP